MGNVGQIFLACFIISAGLLSNFRSLADLQLSGFCVMVKTTIVVIVEGVTECLLVLNWKMAGHYITRWYRKVLKKRMEVHKIDR